MMRRNMEQSDLDLLHAVPLYHLQTLIKTRRLPLSPNRVPPDSQTLGASIDRNLEKDLTSAEPSSITVGEIAQHLFNPDSIDKVLTTLGEKEKLILHELVACGGRANSRDLALYLMSSGYLLGGQIASNADRETPLFQNALESPSGPVQGYPQGVPPYPIPHPHGVFELAVRHLLLQGLLFWGKQTNFGGRDYASGVYDGVLIVPPAVMAVVNTASENLPPTGDLPARAGIRVNLGEGLYRLQRTLYLYWSLVAAM